jgi:hypothetical protein
LRSPARAHGSIVLVTFGIMVSIPIVVWGSKLVLALMDRFPDRDHGWWWTAWLDRWRHAGDRPGTAGKSGMRRFRIALTWYQTFGALLVVVTLASGWPAGKRRMRPLNWQLQTAEKTW